MISYRAFLARAANGSGAPWRPECRLPRDPMSMLTILG